MGILLVDVLAISDADQTFDIDAFVKVRWQDPRLANFSGCQVVPSEIWNPKLELINSSRLRTRLQPRARIGEDGWVELTRRFTGHVVSPHTLEKFPFDERFLRLGIAPRDYQDDEVIVSIAEEFSGRNNDFSIADWSIGSHDVSTDVWKLPRLKESRSRLIYKLPARRLRGYWVGKVMVPLLLIIAMSWAVFWIDAAHFATAIALAATSMLTLIAFQFSIARSLPRVSYLTLLDTFIFGAAVLVFLALVEAVLTSALVGHGKGALARRLDYHGRWILPLALLTLVAWGLDEGKRPGLGASRNDSAYAEKHRGPICRFVGSHEPASSAAAGAVTA